MTVKSQKYHDLQCVCAQLLRLHLFKMLSRLCIVAPKKVSFAFARFSTKEKVVPAATKQKNFVVALGLLGFVGGIYYTAISKMKQNDDLAAVIEQEIDVKPKK